MTELKYFNILRIGLRHNFIKLWKVIDEYKKFEHIYSRISEVVRKLNIRDNIMWNKLNADLEYERLIRNNVKILTFWDNDYPTLLREIYIPPLGIYVKGDTKCFNERTNLAVVGSRHPTDYGERAVEKIIRELNGVDVNIISGLAIGLDSCSHKNALKFGLKTIGVIGSGFAHFAPKRNIWLAKEIIKNGGAVVSEYPICFTPEKYYFIERNRIITGMSKGVLLVEAKRKGGTMASARFAEEQNRDIFVIPNNILIENGEGTNWLIKEGAKMVDSGEDIINEMNL